MKLKRQIPRPGRFRRRGRKGSSLALVMMIGAALVIWVMCIMPLMNTTGTTALKTQGELDDYLENRSAIEFCKSELEYMTRSSVPKTFAVIDNGGEYEALRKRNDAGSVNETDGSYASYITYGTNDAEDTPNDTLGDKVAAICSVVGDTPYEITIQTYNNGEKGMKYQVDFTASGSLLIHPEAYKQSQALPLSDFVLVDGKLGGNQVWDSTITSAHQALNTITENLLPWRIDASKTYANAGEYPAVFKTTAIAAVGDNDSIGDALKNEYTDETWIEPTKDNTTVKDGKIYVDDKLVAGKIYYNGKDTAPNNGHYQISVDIDQNDDKKILGVMGLQLNTVVVDGGVGTQKTAEASSVVSIEQVGETYKVTLKEVPGVRYGYCTTRDDIQWQESNVIEGLEEKTYYFYTYTPASIDEDGTFHAASKATYSGCIYRLVEVSSIDKGGKYLLASGDAESGYNVAYVNYNKYSPTQYSLKVDSVRTDCGFMTAEPNSLNQYLWVTEREKNNKDDSAWLLRDYSYEKYLKLDGSYDGILIWYSWTFTHSMVDSSKKDTVNIAFNGIDVSITKNLKSNNQTTTAYFFINDGNVTVNNSSVLTVKFLHIPSVSAPNVTPPSVAYTLDDLSITYGESAVAIVNRYLPEGVKVDTLYLNGAKVDATTTVKPGVYSIRVVTNEGAANLTATLTVKKATLDDTSVTITTVQDEDDDQKITVTAQNLPADGDTKHGKVYIGYKKNGDETYQWFPEDENHSYTFRLPYGEYQFAVKETGSLNYEGKVIEHETKSLSPLPLTLNVSVRTQFAYTVDSEGTVTWYNKLPNKVNMDRIRLYYGVADGDKNISWSENYSDNVSYYGVYMENVTYVHNDDQEKSYLHEVGDKTILQLLSPVNVSSANGHTASMLRGESLYFMGSTSSINTFGNSIYLDTDLLVLNGPITGDGAVHVTPYTTGSDSMGYTLLFNANQNPITIGSVTLDGRTFYKVEKNTNLLAVSSLERLCKINAATGSEDRGKYDDIQYQMRTGKFPELNLDIAYANETQLSHIISGETIGWTKGGVLKGSSTETNAAYAVCAYVSEIQSQVSYKANRVLIAANTGESYTLTVPADLTFTTRYLSVDADQIVQGSSGVKFTLKNLGQDKTFIEEIIKVLFDGKVTQYQSKTLQMDYERTTNIVVNGTTTPMKAQICRYNEEADLFSSAESDQPQSLIVTYTPTEIQKMNASDYGSIITTVDRYVSILDDGSGSINLSSWYMDYRIFANYVYFDPKVETISICRYPFGNAVSDSDIRVSSQESGYGSNEYLYWFQNGSTESYTGTLLYFGGDVDVILKRSKLIGDGEVILKTTHITKGFYYVPASSGGCSLFDLMQKNDDGSYRYKIDPATLKDYSIYIDENGNISDAYVDTGIYDSNSVGTNGGFSGGKVG